MSKALGITVIMPDDTQWIYKSSAGFEESNFYFKSGYNKNLTNLFFFGSNFQFSISANYRKKLNLKIKNSYFDYRRLRRRILNSNFE